MSKIQFDKLEIERERYGKNKGQYTGFVSYSGENANMQLKINDEQIKRIFEVVAARMIEVSKEAADELTCDIIESLPTATKVIS